MVRLIKIIILWCFGLCVGIVVLLKVGIEIRGFLGLDNVLNIFLMDCLVNILLWILVSM